jgi:monoterpene epsilon-lactone hydrolase
MRAIRPAAKKIPPATAGGRGRRRLLLSAIAAGLVLIAAVAAITFSRYGDRPLVVTDSQRAALSEEGITYLDSERSLRLPDVLIESVVTSERLIQERDNFAITERILEDELISRLRLDVASETIGGIPVTVVTPPNTDPARAGQIAINIHGGAFFLGNSRDRVGLMLAHELGIPVYSIGYSLAPEAVYPTAIEQSLAVYRELTHQYDAQNIVAFASSSGANLLAATMLRAQDEDLPMIAALGLFTPITDFTGVGDSPVANDRRDGLVANLRQDVPARFYAGDEPLDSPGLSPVYGQYDSTFPPTFLTTSTRDLNLSDTVRLHVALDAADVDARLYVAEGMPHGHHGQIDLPEAIQTRAAAAEFLLDQLDR